jgi:hypothetical protein
MAMAVPISMIRLCTPSLVSWLIQGCGAGGRMVEVSHERIDEAI